ncbi:hypothetical protein ASB57_03780 [Bordetella sp. N]|nr:hypothetical protein ASB57_03780 [Bordetella sp. N]
MEVFWLHGYNGTAMSDLTEAMGINSPSIYSAFGSKRGLFDAVLDRYDQRRADFKEHFLTGKTARDVVEMLLRGTVQWLTSSNEPRGCLLVQAGLATGGDGQDIPALLARRRKRLEHLLTARFDQAKVDGDLGVNEDSSALARYVQTIFSGLAVQAAAGASAAELDDVVTRIMPTWPASPSRKARPKPKPTVRNPAV